MVVFWLDPWHDNGDAEPVSTAIAKRLAPHETTGYVIRHDADIMVLASDVDYHDGDPETEPTYQCYWVIRTDLITSVHGARKRKEKKREAADHPRQ